MKRSILALIAGSLVGCASLGPSTGYYASPPPAAHVSGEPLSGVVVIVDSLPPAPLDEVIPPAPFVDETWIPGYWHYDGVSWIWISGHYVSPLPGYVYVFPVYEPHHHGCRYRPGRWKKKHRPTDAHPRSGTTVVAVDPPKPRARPPRRSAGYHRPPLGPAERSTPPPQVEVGRTPWPSAGTTRPTLGRAERTSPPPKVERGPASPPSPVIVMPPKPRISATPTRRPGSRPSWRVPAPPRSPAPRAGTPVVRPTPPAALAPPRRPPSKRVAPRPPAPSQPRAPAVVGHSGPRVGPAKSAEKKKSRIPVPRSKEEAALRARRNPGQIRGPLSVGQSGD